MITGPTLPFPRVFSLLLLVGMIGVGCSRQEKPAAAVAPESLLPATPLFAVLETEKGPIEIELLCGLRIAPRAEILAVGAVEVALRRDVVRGDQRMKHAIATHEFGEVKQIVGGG